MKTKTLIAHRFDKRSMNTEYERSNIYLFPDANVFYQLNYFDVHVIIYGPVIVFSRLCMSTYHVPSVRRFGGFSD